MAYTVDSLQIEVATQSGKAVNGLRALTNALKELKSVTKVSLPAKLADSIRGIGDVLKGIDNEDITKLERLGNAMQQLTGIKGTVKVPKIDVSGAKEAKEATDGIKESTQQAEKSAEGFASKVFTVKNVLKGVKEGTDAVKHSFDKVKKLVDALGRIALYRALRTVIKEVAQAFDEGLKNAYAFSKSSETFTRLAEALDKISSIVGQLRNQLGAMLGELVTSFTPVIENLVDKGTRLANFLTELFAALGGQDTYLQAQAISKSWDEATDSAKKYKQQLLGIDEINNLSAGKGSDNGINAEDMFKVVKVRNTMEKFASGFIDTLDVIKTLAIEIGIAMLAWKIKSNLPEEATALSGILGGIAKVASGLALITIGATISFKFSEKIGLGSDDFKDKVGVAVGMLASTIGGAVIGGVFGGAPGAGIGAIIGFTIGLATSIIGYNKGIARKAEEDFWNSNAGQYIKKLKETIANNRQLTADISVQIRALDGSIDSETMATLDNAKRLIQEIFAFDSRENKTASEIDVIKSKIKLLNGLGLEGLNLAFDDATGHVTKTKEEVMATYDALLKQFRLEAMKEDIIEAYRLQGDQQEALAEAQKVVSESTYAVAMANNRAESATKAYSDALQKLNDYTEQYKKNGNNKIGVGLTDEYKRLQEAVTKAKDEMNAANVGVREAKSAFYEAQGAVTDANKSLDEAAKKIQNLENGYYDLMNATEDATKATKEFIDEAKKLGDIKIADTIADAKGLKTNGAASQRSISAFADGGFVNSGTLFYAGEAGPEFVGSMGGQTAVANTDQMSDAIRQAAYEGMSQALRENGSTVVLSPDADKIFNITRQKGREYTRMTGQSWAY